MTMRQRLSNCVRFCATCIVFVTAMAGARVADAAQRPSELVQAQLVANVNSVKPGEPFQVGLLMKMAPKWHVYWKNPGDSGAAPRVKWNLPPRFRVGELRFPLPVQFDQGGGVIGYGYHDEVMLLTEITPPADLSAAHPIDLAADVSWLVCESVCVPGKAALKLSLPVGDTNSPANKELFEKWLWQFPLPGEKALDAKEFELTGDDPLTARVTWRAGKVKNVEWFPVPPEGSAVENVQVRNSNRDSTMTFSLVPAPETGKTMQFLVTYTGGTGNRHGVEFTVNLPPRK